MRNNILNTTFAILLAPLLGYSANPPAPHLPSGLPPPPPKLPVDQGLLFLIGAGIILAGYQLIITRKRQKAQSEI